MTLPYTVSAFNRWTWRTGLILLAPLALVSHLGVAIGLAVKVWAGKLADAWRSA